MLAKSLRWYMINLVRNGMSRSMPVHVLGWYIILSERKGFRGPELPVSEADWMPALPESQWASATVLTKLNPMEWSKRRRFWLKLEP